ncbi:serine hydrolase [Streptomyces sp. NPDC051364]|uniref:serine hydrolase n=1 Tax=Streptomyces sp. NPDC051364 TaxID=3155799 RepID=UPI00342E68B5
MRRSPALAFTAALLLVSGLAPAAVPAAAARAPLPVAVSDPYGDGCPRDGLGPGLTARLDRAIERTRHATDWNPSWGWAAAAMIFDLHDLRHWARVVATGTLLSPATQAERLKMLPTGLPGNDYGLGIFDNHGWIGHNGSLPGYENVTVYLPAQRATLVVLINTDIHHRGGEPSTLLAKTITGIATPDDVYDIPPQK